MSNQNNQIPKTLTKEQAEQVTADIVTPMLQLMKYSSYLKDSDGNDVAPPPNTKPYIQVDPSATLLCLHYWSAIQISLAMKFSAQNALAYLINSYSIDTELIRHLQVEIGIADDNIQVMTEKLLEYGISL